MKQNNRITKRLHIEEKREKGSLHCSGDSCADVGVFLFIKLGPGPAQRLGQLGLCLGPPIK
jgi:hypothetical protein